MQANNFNYLCVISDLFQNEWHCNQATILKLQNTLRECLENLLPGLEQGVELQAYPRSPTELLTRT